MPTAQDFYNSLIKNPNYQGAEGLSREELVKREAIRRARQHHNNEMALSMASEPISAMAKLSQFVDYMPLEKAWSDFDAAILNNIRRHRETIDNLAPYLESYADRGEELGWNKYSDLPAYRDNPAYRIASRSANDHVTIFTVAEYMAKVHSILKLALDFYDDIPAANKDADGNITTFPPMGFVDTISADEQAIFDDTFLGSPDSPGFGKVKPSAIAIANGFMEKANDLHAQVVDDRGTGEREEEREEGTGGGGEANRGTFYDSLLDAQPADVKAKHDALLGEGNTPEEGLNAIKAARNHFGLPSRTARGRGRSHPRDSFEHGYETDEYNGDDADDAEHTGLDENQVRAYDAWKQQNQQEQLAGDSDPDPWTVIRMARNWRAGENIRLPVSADYNYDHIHGTPSTGQGGFDFRTGTGGAGGEGAREETTPQTFEQRYDQYTPKQIDGDDPPPLYPKEFDEATGTLGDDFKPMEGLTEENLEERINQLKEVFKNMHQDRTDNKATLGSGNFFPSEERPEGGLHFKIEDFDPEHIDSYNKLNTNKAIIEEYIRVLQNAKNGTENLPWRTTINHPVTQEEREAHPKWEEGVWGTEAGFTIPAVGTWLWHSMLDSFGGAAQASANYEEGRDAFGNLPFHSLPNDAAHFNNRSYSYDFQKQRAYMGRLGLFPSSLQEVKDFIGQNDGLYPDFKNHVGHAWSAFGGRRSGLWDDPGKSVADFMDWINDVDANGNLRHQAWVNGAQDSFEAVPETDEERAGRISGEGVEEFRARIGAERQAQVVQAQATEEERQRIAQEQADAEAQHEAEKKKYRDRILDHEDKLGFANDEDRRYLEEHLEDDNLKTLQGRWSRIMGEKEKGRREQVKADKKTAGREVPEGLDEDQRKDLIDEYVNSYREMHHQPVIPGWVKILEGMSDKDLVAKHRDLIDQFGASKRTEAQNHRENMANNVGYAIPSLAPQQKHLTKEDILLQARKLVHHQAAYGKLMNGDAKKVWKERYDEAHQLGNAANMDLELLMQKDRAEAEESGDYGSTAWLERVGEAQEEVLTRRAGHKKAVNQGAELRANRNYKPHIVAQYDQDGSFLSYMDLRTGQPVDSHELGFDDDNHYFFHGLDPDKVKKYQQYQKLNKDHTPEIPNPFDPPVPSSDEDFEALKQEVHGDDYKDVRNRLDAVGELPGAHQVFHNKFTRQGGRPGLPTAPDGSAEAAPRFYEDAGDRQGMVGWYHPESESWINPYRHKYLLDSMEGQQGSGRVVLGGQSYFGRDRRDNPNILDPNRNYQFAIPTKAKQAKLRTGYGDQSYYIDDTGSIAHAQDSFANSHHQTHDQPQTINGVIHDWYAQEINNHMQANPQAFKDEQGKVMDVANIDAPQQPPVQAPPLQNMWLELQSPTNLGREPGSALERRERKKSMGWNWKASKLGRVRHPLAGTSSPARDPLSTQELGQQKWWGARKELKQKWFDAWDYPQSQLASWVGRTLGWGVGMPGLTAENPEDSVIRRIRRGYKQQAVAERLVRDSANRTTVNGKRLSDIYVAPGEQKARGEDYQELSDYLRNRAAHHQIRRGEAQEAKNEENQKFHTAKNLHYRDEHNKLTRLKADMPNHWKQINDIYTAHLGRVNQAPPADEALQQWGGEMRQPQQEDWGVKMRQPSQQDSPQQQQSGIPNPFDSQSGSDKAIPNPFASQPPRNLTPA